MKRVLAVVLGLGAMPASAERPASELRDDCGLEPPGALAKISDGYTFHQESDRVAHLLHNGADGASGLIRAGAGLVKPLAHTADGRQCAFEVPNDARQRNLVGWQGEPIPAGNTPPTFNHAG